MKFKSGNKTKNIEIKGARVHNLKNIDVEILDIKGNILVNIWGEDQDTEKEYEFDNKLGASSEVTKTY